MNKLSKADLEAQKLKPVKEDEKSIYEIEADFVCDTIRKCIKTEPKVAKEKKLNVYRKLSKETIDLLSEVNLEVESLEKSKEGIYHIITWKSLKSIGVK